MVFFFFSSRRRHTRSLRDWSSDVCSSDLAGVRRGAQPRAARAGGSQRRSHQAPAAAAGRAAVPASPFRRSLATVPVRCRDCRSRSDRMATRRLWRRGGNSMKRTIGWVVVAAGLGVARLDGCGVPLVGAAAVGGTVVATDRRPVGIQVEDKAIESRVNAALIDKIPKTAMNINVTSYNRKVLLAGQVRTAEMRALAEQAAAKVENVRQVVNELTVGQTASLGDRTDDTL